MRQHLVWLSLLRQQQVRLLLFTTRRSTTLGGLTRSSCLGAQRPAAGASTPRGWLICSMRACTVHASLVVHRASETHSMTSCHSWLVALVTPPVTKPGCHDSRGGGCKQCSPMPCFTDKGATEGPPSSSCCCAASIAWGLHHLASSSPRCPAYGTRQQCLPPACASAAPPALRWAVFCCGSSTSAGKHKVTGFPAATTEGWVTTCLPQHTTIQARPSHTLPRLLHTPPDQGPGPCLPPVHTGCMWP